jgi:hypothetical protein
MDFLLTCDKATNSKREKNDKNHCNGRSFPYTADGNNAYIQAINVQADKVVLR